jgi:hypothetical protein
LIAYDDSAEYTFRRANLNAMLKSFVNSHIPDPLIYLGSAQEKIQLAVAQTLCWVESRDWERLAARTDAACDLTKVTTEQLRRDEHILISHSLGSRVVIDALHRLATLAGREGIGGVTRDERMASVLRDKEFTLFMLANQLPLLQLGRPPPEVTGQIAQICTEGGAKRDQRQLRRLNIVAFSDPNDLLSWAVPPDYVDNNMDSRLCPVLTNVLINVAEVKSVFGMELAMPGEAHANYDNDERVIAFMTRGIGTERTDPLIATRCEWLETR